MTKHKARIILNKLRERIAQEFPYDSLRTDKEKDLFDDIDEFIMNFEDEL